MKRIPTIPFLLEQEYTARKRHHTLWRSPNLVKQNVLYSWRKATASKRVMPDFLIIGEPKCGTTSLFNYLMQSPDAVLPMCKEVHFFDLLVHWNNQWMMPNFSDKKLVDDYRNQYRSFFPLKSSLDSKSRFTGEATAALLRHGGVLEIMKRILPKKTKFIVVFRNPIYQRKSEYYYEFTLRGMKNRIPNFDDHIMEMDLDREADNYQTFSRIYKYLAVRVPKAFNCAAQILDPASSVPSVMYTPCYADLLATWYETFPEKDRLLILSFEDLVAQSQQVVNTIADFLDIQRFALKTTRAFKPTASYDSRSNPEMKDETKAKLMELFKPYNQKLYKMTGRDFGWENM